MRLPVDTTRSHFYLLPLKLFSLTFLKIGMNTCLRASKLALPIFLIGILMATCVEAASAMTEHKPFWIGAMMEGDPVLFIQEDGASSATAKLLFKADAGLRVTSFDGAQVYEANRDYTWQPGSDVITLTPKSRIPYKTRQEMFPAKGASRSFGELVQDNQKGVLFSEGRFYQDLHVLVSYRHHDSWTGAVPPAGSSNLDHTAARLASKQPVKIVLLGDSISEGACSSLFINAPPYLPPYINLWVSDLQKRFGAPITMTNLSVGGKASPWGLTMIDKVTAEKPDVVLIAFGMNDSEPAEDYALNIENIVTAIKSKCPQADIILVAGMTGNPLLTSFNKDRFESYRDALKKMEAPGVAVADVTSIWIDLLKQKSFFDLTGNGVNHPNDFGHRLYADVLAALLPPINHSN
jgi:acyl-CoA thioesterase-1